MFNKLPNNWNSNPAVINGIKQIIGEQHIRQFGPDKTDCHPIIWFLFNDDFSPSAEMKVQIGKLLSGMGWQLVNDVDESEVQQGQMEKRYLVRPRCFA